MKSCFSLPMALTLGAVLVWCGPAAAQIEDGEGSPEEYERFEQLAREHEQRLRDLRGLEERMETLARQIRRQRRAGSAVAIRDLGPLIEQLDSEDFQKRTRATDLIRRTLLQRIWQLGEERDLSPEASQRLRRLLIETATLSQLAPLMLQLEASQRDRLFTLMDTEPAWVTAALGREPARIRQALEHPPEDFDEAVAIVRAHLLSDPLRPYPQLIALQSLRDLSHPLVRQAVVDLIKPMSPDQAVAALGMGGMQFTGPNWINAFGNQNSIPYQALQAIRRHRVHEALPWLLGSLARQTNWSNQTFGVLVEVVVSLDERDAAPHLYDAARRLRERHKNSRWGDENRFNMRPGDSLMWGAAALAGMDLGELGFVSAAAGGWGGVENMYGFMSAETRDNAWAAVEAQFKDAAPFGDIPGLDEAEEELDTLLGPVQ